MERLFSICSLSALHLGIGGDTPPEQLSPGMKHVSPLRTEASQAYFIGFIINGRQKVSEIER
jgi:hypothetical protein